MAHIGIDVGGTKVLGGIVSDEGVILHQVRRDTPRQGGDALTQVIADLAHELLSHTVVAHQKIEAIGVCAAGFISSDRKTILATPNIAAWNSLNLHQELTQKIGVRIVLENDANAALWAESRFGAGRGETNLLMLTLGTGVGGALIVNGKLVRGEFGVAAELGHIRLIPEGIRCGCGARGCFEKYVSGSALTQQTLAVMKSQRDKSRKILEKGDGTFSGFRSEHLTLAAMEGDAFSQEIFHRYANYLGQGIAMLSIVTDPAKIIIGGGIVTAWELLYQATIQSVVDNMPFSGLHPFAEVVPAQLGDSAGLIGVADLSRI